MPFPTAPVRRDFSEADHSPDGAFSVNPDGSYLTANVKVLGGQLFPIDGDAWIYLNNETLPVDCEAYFREVTQVGAPQIFVRCAPLGSIAMNGYLLSRVGVGTFQLLRLDAGVDTVIGASMFFSHSDGDAFGMQAIGSSIECFHQSGNGPWVSMAVRVDATYQQRGALVMYIPGGSVDDLGYGPAVLPGANAIAVGL